MAEVSDNSGYISIQTSRANDLSNFMDIQQTNESIAKPSATSGQTATSGSDDTYRYVPLPHPWTTTSIPAPPHQTFCSNVVITSKYTLFNFLPLFTIESFRKLANAYFLLVSILQCITAISNTGGIPTNLPTLLFILSVDGILAIVEDRRRHIADHEANSAQCLVVNETYHAPTPAMQAQAKPTEDPTISKIYWSALTVGTVVKLRNRETAPADLLILAVDELDPTQPNGICYVETKSLDGETNLKLRHACDGTLTALTSTQILALQGFIRCENPNKVIGRFDGTLSLITDRETIENYPLSIKNVLLRGCQLRNTEWMYGIVLNTGSDTKIMQSAAKSRPKWSSINETVNRMIIWLFALLCILCILATTAQVVWIDQNKSTVNSLLVWFPSLVSQWFIGFGSYFLLMYQMIPVSLYVTISMVMFIQARFMTLDIDMYYEELDVRMIVRSMGLNEELGQISYVFSDKTGTLTCNVMEFRKCSINGVSYGKGTTEIGRAALRRRGIVVSEEEEGENTKNKKIPYVNFEDPKLIERLSRSSGSQDSVEAEFFLHLALCQTVIPEKIEGTNEIRFSASSPDEQALVCGAKYFGFSFESRGLGIARVSISNKAFLKNKALESEIQEYQILDVLEFTSDRKRMSVITQYPNGQYWILTKGADNVIYPLLSKTLNRSELLRETMAHLEAYGDDGLRTLTIARRQLELTELTSWRQRFKEACASLEEIEKRKNGLPNKIDETMAEIEQGLVLLGATAIEDKLQQHVPRTIANLMKASMKVWMLTGDKQETAINISYACQLMDNDMKQIVLNLEVFPTESQLIKHLTQANEASERDPTARKAVVIDGECLEVTLLNDRMRHEFLTLAMSCEAVVCCRVSPSQKAEVVSLVCAANPKVRTLSIGDGANDVAMIQRAHVGVGICGQEGMQAVNSSDYAIGQFSFLEKLLLHHGRLNYKRMSILVGYMFYKNIVMVLAQYYYMYTTGSSGQKFYSEFSFQLYNIAYTSFPIIVLGVFDVDVPWSIARYYPELYHVGPRMELFNNRTFMKWIASALFEAGMITFFALYGFNEDRTNTGSAPIVQYGLITFTLVVLVCNLKLIMLQMSWTFIGAIAWFIGVLSYIPVSIIVSSVMATALAADYGSFQNTLLEQTYWLVIPVCCIAALIRHFAFNAFQRRFYPESWQIVQEKYVLGTTLSSTNNTDLETGAMVEEGMSSHGDDRDGIAYEDHSSPLQQHKRDRSLRLSSSSGFAFSFDPQTTAAESYIASHSITAASSAISEAELRQRTSRADSRSSDFSGDVNVTVNVDGSSPPTIPHSISSDRTRASTGLFV